MSEATKIKESADQRYKKALKQMIYSRECFSITNIEREVGIGVISGVLRDLEWVRKVDGGSEWCGPQPKTEKDLMVIVRRVRQGVRDLDKKRRDQQKKETMEKDYDTFKRLVERLAKGPGGFKTEELLEEFGVHFKVEQLLRDLHWIKPRKGSDADFYIGPLINTEDELQKAARFLLSQFHPEQSPPEPQEDLAITLAKKVAHLEKSWDHVYAENERHVKEKREIIAKYDKLFSENERLKRELAKREVKVEPISMVSANGHGSEVSLLWGMFKMKRA